MLLFGRQVYAQFGLPGTEGRSFKDLRISFSAEFTRAGTPNKGSVDIYNLAPESLQAIQLPGVVVRVFAGYDVPRLIFSGNPVKNGVKILRQGPDRIAHVEVQDGGNVYAGARVSLNFATDTTLSQVLAAVSAQVGLPAGAIRPPGDVHLPYGCTYSGPARDILDRLARGLGSDWFIRDGALCFVGSGADTGETVLVISADSGNMVNSPAPQDDGKVEVTALLDPSLRPGRLFQIRSERVNGLFICDSVRFQGDTHAQPFYATAIGIRR